MASAYCPSPRCLRPQVESYIFPPRVFTELKNGQAVAIPYDGLNPLPPQFCYLKPHYLNANTSYFDPVDRGAL